MREGKLGTTDDFDTILLLQANVRSKIHTFAHYTRSALYARALAEATSEKKIANGQKSERRYAKENQILRKIGISFPKILAWRQVFVIC